MSGVAAGTAVVRASLSGCPDAVFDVTVLPEGESVDIIKPRYLTITKNAVMLAEPDDSIALLVTGVNISDAELATGTVWSDADPTIIQVSAAGTRATVTAIKTGKTKNSC